MIDVSSSVCVACAGGGSSTAGGSQAAEVVDLTNDEEVQLLAQQGFWSCGVCTFNNTDLAAAACAMCSQPRR